MNWKITIIKNCLFGFCFLFLISSFSWSKESEPNNTRFYVKAIKQLDKIVSHQFLAIFSDLKPNLKASILANEKVVFMCTGTGTVVSDIDVSDAANADGTPNGTFASLYQTGDAIVLDLGTSLSAATTITITYERVSSSVPIFNIQTSNNVSSGFSAVVESPFTVPVNQGVTGTFTVTVPAGNQYLEIESDNGFDAGIDGISFTCPSGGSGTGIVNGVVFRDFDGDGIRDTNEPLVSGISVMLYDSLGNTCGSAVTTLTGSPNYSITKTCTGPVRIEFSIGSNSCVDNAIDFSALAGNAYGSAIQFLDEDGTANFAVQAPEDFNCGITDSLMVYVPCYLQGNPLDPTAPDHLGNLDWFVGYKYSESGVAGTDFTLNKIDGTVIGATWGTAYSRQADVIFTSAFLRRHVGFGQLGSGGIYTIDPNTFTPSTFYDMDANGHRTRADGTAPAYGEGTSYNIAADNGTITYLGTNDPLTGEPAGLGVIGSNER